MWYGLYLGLCIYGIIYEIQIMNPWEFRLWQQISFWCVWHIDMFHYQRGIRANQSINQRVFIVDAISISDFSVTSQYLMDWHFTIFLTLYVVRNDAVAVSQYQPRLGQCQNRDREILIPPGFLLAWLKTSGRWCKVKIKSGAMSSLPKVDCDSRTNAVSRGWKVDLYLAGGRWRRVEGKAGWKVEKGGG